MPLPAIGAVLKAVVSSKLAKKKKKFGEVKNRLGALGKGDITTALIGTENSNLLSDALKSNKKRTKKKTINQINTRR